jgi:hypothetical protein
MPKDPAREQARQIARNQGLKPTRLSALERMGMPDASEAAANHSEQVSKRQPSRNSRSMKSRQSEPRVSRSGQKRNSKAAAKSKPPYVLMSVAAVFVVVGLILLSRVVGTNAGRTAVDDVHVRVPGAAQVSAFGMTTSSPESVQVALNNAPQTIATASAKLQPAINLTQPKDIQVSQIASFSNGIPQVITFRDGSRMNADPVTLEQLPAEVRLQLTYTRGQP